MGSLWCGHLACIPRFAGLEACTTTSLNSDPSPFFVAGTQLECLFPAFAAFSRLRFDQLRHALKLRVIFNGFTLGFLGQAALFEF
jgi:hypothetical protein